MCKGPDERSENGLGLLSLSNDMGRRGANASGSEPVRGPSTRLSRFEQLVGESAMACSLAVLSPDALDLGFEQRNALQQLVLRIGVERFAGQPARGISAHPGEIVVHCNAA